LTQTRSHVRDTTASRKRQVRMRKVKSTIKAQHGRHWNGCSATTWQPYLQTWKLKLSTTKTVSAAFHL